VGLRASLDAVDYRTIYFHFLESNSGCPAHKLIAIPSELSRLPLRNFVLASSAQEYLLHSVIIQKETRKL
jgi:hypothetical protein